MGARPNPYPPSDVYTLMDPQFSAYPYPRFTPQPPHMYDQPAPSIPVGTIIHKGFYDLLAMIPTPSPSRLIWGAPPASPLGPDPIIAGPRYENIGPSPARATAPAVSVKKGRRISKDMVSKPTGFVHLVHASDADQLEALLTRWGPDGVGKLGDPRWANPIKSLVRQSNQAKAINEVVNSSNPARNDWLDESARGELRVMNGLSITTNSSMLTTAAQENVNTGSTALDGLPGRPGNSTIRWGHGLKAHPEVHEGEESTAFSIQSPPPRIIIPSLATLDKAVSARIYFENLYFPLFRHPPSREQRRLAMEKDMMAMNLSQEQKEHLRSRWRQNETDYLRDRRRKVDASAFIKLKTIGHGRHAVAYGFQGAFGVVSLVREQSTGNLYAMKQLRKTDMLRKGQEGHVRAERDVLKSASMVNSPTGAEWIVLEYMGGGDLLNLLIERDVFEEDFARFYVAELLHKHGIDLEDSNGIADGKGTRKMSRKDIELLMGNGEGQGGVFTWREKNRRKLAYSVCGTNSYMSPEVIRGNGYTYSCDWWSLGVIMFECLYGFPPFVSNSRHVTRQKILNWKQSLRFPSRPRVSHEGVNLMQQLLCEPEDRLGSQSSASVSRPNSLIVQARRSSFIPQQGSSIGNDGADLIKAHPFFRGIDWLNIHRYPAPYRPELHHPEDTRHFDSDIPPEPLAPANGAPADATRDPMLRDKVHGAEILNSRKALAFAGFTHKSPRAISYLRADKAFDPVPDTYGQQTVRGRPVVRETREVGKGRAISL
ncbi:hypothetical protein H0H81_009173 [Sphagnurus paluster]|uniref:non-specific serine/threonine protein kinase n=1 Tax=Sphagnurus paluster TaxID=117069 RepID=A0A9P7FX64_9AGAR|nr:hypothetical protein H0H81_009173 [Sphagnurus paluster]